MLLSIYTNRTIISWDLLLEIQLPGLYHQRSKNDNDKQKQNQCRRQKAEINQLFFPIQFFLHEISFPAQYPCPASCEILTLSQSTSVESMKGNAASDAPLPYLLSFISLQLHIRCPYCHTTLPVSLFRIMQNPAIHYSKPSDTARWERRTVSTWIPCSHC